MASPNKVIITCAITGSIHTPSMSPYLPITPDQIADSAIGAAEAGAAIVHLHARNPETGRPDQSPEAFGRFLPRIKQRSNVVINLTSGGAPSMKVEERVSPAHHFKPEVASLNMGSMNFALFPMLNRYKEFKHDWEKPYLEGTRDLVFRNTFKDIEFILRTCADNGTRFEFECYDVGHLYNLRISLNANWSSRRCSCKPCSAFSAASVPIPKTSCTCGAPPTVYWAAKITAGPCLGRVATKCRLRRCLPQWGATCALVWKIRSGFRQANSASRMRRK